MSARKGTVGPIEWGMAERHKPGETAMGDRGVVLGTPTGAIVAVVDGLGHGPKAAEAANVAVEVLQRFHDKPVTDILARCHDALRGTRGVVMSIAAFDSSRHRMTWAGVGNVEGVIAPEYAKPGSRPTALISRPGILGYRLPKLRPVSLPLEPGLTAILATDGIDSSFVHEVRPVGSPDRVAQRILATHGSEKDDALVLVARYLGNQG